MFSWLRKMAYNAVMAGAHDAVADLKAQAAGLPEHPQLLLADAVVLPGLVLEGTAEPAEQPATNGHKPRRTKASS